MVLPNIITPPRPYVEHNPLSAQLAGYRWLCNMVEEIPIDGFDFEIAMRIWTVMSRDLFCCFECGDDVWCEHGLNYWMSGIIIYLIKFYGNGGSVRGRRQDRLTLRQLRTRYLTGERAGLNRIHRAEEMVEFELELIEMIVPILAEISAEMAIDGYRA